MKFRNRMILVLRFLPNEVLEMMLLDNLFARLPHFPAHWSILLFVTLDEVGLRRWSHYSVNLAVPNSKLQISEMGYL